MKLTKKEFRKLKNRNPEVFERLYNFYKNRVYNYIMVLSGYNQDVSEEVFSDVIHSAFESVNRLKNDKNILGWLLRIAKNKYNDYLRRIYKTKRIVNGITGNLRETLSENTDITDQISSREKLELLKLCMDNLKPHYSDIIRLKYFDKLSHNEIALKYSKSRDACESMLQRAVSSLRNEILKLSQDL